MQFKNSFQYLKSFCWYYIFLRCWHLLLLWLCGCCIHRRQYFRHIIRGLACFRNNFLYISRFIIHFWKTILRFLGLDIISNRYHHLTKHWHCSEGLVLSDVPGPKWARKVILGACWKESDNCSSLKMILNTPVWKNSKKSSNLAGVCFP